MSKAATSALDKTIAEQGAAPEIQPEQSKETPAVQPTAPKNKIQEKQEPVSEPVSEPEAAPEPEPAKPAMIKIMISSDATASGDEPVFVSLNGKSYQIRRDVEVEVPRDVYQVLADAVIAGYVTDENGTVIKGKNINRFSITVINI